MVTEAPPDKRTTEGYSLPASLHLRIREEAEARDMNRSDLVRKAVRFYLRVHAQHDDSDRND